MEDSVLASARFEVLVCSRARLGTEWRTDNGREPFARLYYLVGGAAHLAHHGRRWLMRPGSLYLTPAHTDVAFRCPRWFDVWYIHFTGILFGGLDLFDYLACDYAVPVREPRHTQGLYARLRRILGSGWPGEPFAARGLLLQLIAPFLATVPPSQREERGLGMLRFREALAYIEAHLDATIRVDDLAARTHVESTHFSRIFRRQFGLPPMRYVLHKRVERAQRLLLQDDLPLAAIAARTGFGDAFHLSKTFRRITGESPSAFRRAHRRPLP